jgi:hypothetical protein
MSKALFGPRTLHRRRISHGPCQRWYAGSRIARTMPCCASIFKNLETCRFASRYQGRLTMLLAHDTRRRHRPSRPHPTTRRHRTMANNATINVRLAAPNSTLPGINEMVYLRADRPTGAPAGNSTTSAARCCSDFGRPSPSSVSMMMRPSLVWRFWGSTIHGGPTKVEFIGTDRPPNLLRMTHNGFTIS